MKIKKILILIYLLNIINFNSAYSQDIPIIVIAPSKKAQSISTVGTSVTVYDQSFLENTNDV